MEVRRATGRGDERQHAPLADHDGPDAGKPLDSFSYSDLYRHTLDGIILYLLDGTILGANPAACAILRTTEATLRSNGRQGLVDPTDERWPRCLAQVQETGNTRSQLRLRRGDGSTVECEVTVTSFPTQSGETHICAVLRDVTATVELVTALADSEARWRATVDNAPIGIAVSDAAGRTHWSNAALQEMLGYDEAALADLTIEQITHRDDFAADLDHFRRLADDEIPSYQLEKRFIRADGDVLPVRISVAKVPAVEGSDEPQRYVAQVQDIRAERALIEAVAASERQMAQAQRTTGVGSWEQDMATGVLTWSAEMFRLLGIPDDEEPTLARFVEQVHPDDRPRVVDALATMDDPDAPREQRYRIQRSDEVREFHAVAEVVTDGDGTVVAQRGTIQDVTELRASERRAQQLADQLGLLLESAGEGIYGVDRRGRFTFLNRAAASMLGWEPEEVIGRNAHELVHHSYPDGSPFPVADCPYLTAIADGVAHTSDEATLWRRDGTSFPARYSAHPLRRDDVVDGAVMTFADTTESRRNAEALRRANDRLRELATTDSLTGLPNRSLFADRLDQALALAEREGWEVAVLFVDLDRFKHVNDSLGHQRGDELLAEVAGRIASSLRDSDTVARLGGDEFAILLGGGSSDADAAHAAERVLACFDTSFVRSGVEHFVSASVGVALWPRHCRNATELLQHADLAMYRAKAAGGGSWEMFEADMTLVTRQQLQLGNDLRRAIDNEEFFLRYQPQIDLRTGAVESVEALIRWQHPRYGEVAPATFIPLLEETGLIVAVGAWVIEEACRESGRLRAIFPDVAPLRISVNISPRQLVHAELEPVIAAALAATGTDPSELELEITESSLIGEGSGAVINLAAIRDSGHLVAIDDFGTGYSSLAYLRRFPVDRLKLDRSFIAELTTGGGPLVSAAQHLADALGLESVAEGVETEDQRRILLELGCTHGQGYLWTVPLRADELHDWMRDRAPR